MFEIILHHYEPSPFSEKARLALGLKRARWRSVIIPQWMPKPDLIALTGGYRKTPVMQIGADIYCDTKLILREIDRRLPKPALDSAGASELIAAWADGVFFNNAVGVAFGSMADGIPREFEEDREKLTGRKFSAARFKAYQPVLRAQYRANIRWVEDALVDGRPFILGQSPSVADFALYHPVWFVAGNVPDTDFLADCPAVERWRARMAKFGNGTPTPLDAKEALAIAKAATPALVTARNYDDPSGARTGRRVGVAANDYGREPASGELLAIDDMAITIRRSDPLVGDVNVHFPRAGFNVVGA